MTNTFGPESQKDWEAECDARTLAQAEEIKKDSPRHERAQQAAARLAKEAKEQADALSKISNSRARDFYESISVRKKEKSG